MKKIYEKPKAEYIAFYSEDEIAASIPVGPIQTYAQEDGGAGGIVGGSGGIGDGGGDWEIN